MAHPANPGCFRIQVASTESTDGYCYNPGPDDGRFVVHVTEYEDDNGPIDISVHGEQSVQDLMYLVSQETGTPRCMQKIFDVGKELFLDASKSNMRKPQNTEQARCELCLAVLFACR